MAIPRLPEFAEDKTYWLKGSTLNDLMRELRRCIPQAGSGLVEDGGPGGTFFNAIEYEQKPIPEPYDTQESGLSGDYTVAKDHIGNEQTWSFENGRLVGVVDK